MSRDEVLIEFAMRQDRAGWTVDAEHWQVNAMADEIVRLRRWNAIRKQAVRIYKRNVELHSQVIDDLLDKLTAIEAERDAQKETVLYLIAERTEDRNRWELISNKLDRAEAIISALREPSLEMRDAVRSALNDRAVTDPIIGEDIDEIIQAAVAAAEKEV